MLIHSFRLFFNFNGFNQYNNSNIITVYYIIKIDNPEDKLPSVSIKPQVINFVHKLN